MGLFHRLFGKSPELNAATAKIDEQVYLLQYSDHYAGVLNEHSTPRRLAELFLFRAWTAQFGYRIFSRNREASERLVGETVNASKYLGLEVFHRTHGFSVEEVLGSEFIALIDDRWNEYDEIASTMGRVDRLPTAEIISAVTGRLGIADPRVTYALSIDFLLQLDLVKHTATQLGLRTGS